MKNYYLSCSLFCVLLLLGQPAITQNWQPISAEQGYYAWLLDGDEAYRFIRVESTFSAGEDLILKLTDRTAPCDTCAAPVTSCIESPPGVFRRFDPHFLQKTLTISPGDRYHFSDTGSVVLLAAAQVGESWMWDTLANVTAMVHAAEKTTLWGQEDSVKTLLLSTGDTVRLAKGLGLLQFPEGYQAGRYFRLKGIQHAKLGITLPTVKDIYDLEVGDRFEYSIYNSQYSDYEDITRQYTILSKTQTPLGVSYSVSGRQYVESYGYNGSSPERTGPYSGVLTYETGPEEFVNSAYSEPWPNSLEGTFGKIVVPGEYQEQGEWGTELSYGIGHSYCAFSPEDTIIGLAYNYDFQVRYVEGIGEVNYSYYYWDYSERRTLQAWQRGDSVLGIFSPDSLFDGNTPPPPAQIPTENSLDQNFPNPANAITIIPFGISADILVTLELYDFHGRHLTNLIDNRVMPAGTYKWEVNTSTLSGGWYYYRLEIGKEVFVKKMRIGR